MKRKLKKIRKKIDDIDRKILELLNSRMRLSLMIKEIKKKLNKGAYSPEREKKIFKNLEKLNKGPIPNDALKNIFYEIINASRSLQQQTKIAYLGPEATFTHKAAIKNFGRYSDYIPCPTVNDVFLTVERGEADFGVVPIENSTEGVVNHTLDMFMDSELKISAEIIESISHALLSNETDKNKIKKIYSHPSAFAQCRRWLSLNLPNAELIEVSSTSFAAKRAKTERNSGAIASVLAAKIYSLNVLKKNIEDSTSNFTRFLVIGKIIPKKSGNDKTSIMFSLKDNVGALHDILYPFKKHQINLTKIESRPSKKKPWEYYFFVDFTGHIDDLKVKRTLKEIEKGALEIKILGSYPSGN